MNLLVLQGGGPTPVINTTLFGVINEAQRSGRFSSVLGARFGIEGLLKDNLIELSSLSVSEMESLPASPGASLGSTRFKPSDEQFQQIINHLAKRNIKHVLMIGGNGSLRGADALARASKDLCVIGVPKTIDNDIAGTDRCPGFGSAAKFVAQSVRDLGMDVRTLPQPVSIFEAMGRNAGWLAGASVLADFDGHHAPHLVYLPEKAFEVAHFLGDIDRIVRKEGWCVAVVTEGLRNARGELIYETKHASQADAMKRPVPGDIAVHLAEVVTRELKIRCRSEKPGLCGRNSMLHVAQQDRADAELVGRAAVRAALENRTGLMASLRPLDSSGEAHELVTLPNAPERTIPPDWLDDSDTRVNESFIRYTRRIVGDLVDYATPLLDRRKS